MRLEKTRSVLVPGWYIRKRLAHPALLPPEKREGPLPPARGCVATVAGALLLVAWSGVALGAAEATKPATVHLAPLRIVVLDPLADCLARDCAKGHARRNYQKLAEYLGSALECPVETVYAESLDSPPAGAAADVDLLIGNFSEVVFHARKLKLPIQPMAMLSDEDGSISQTGLFVVRQDDPARSAANLRKNRLLLGPEESEERHAAALAALEAWGIPQPSPVLTSPDCGSAALAVVEGKADAAVVSGHAMPLLESCGVVEKGVLRVIGRTDSVPFIAVFAVDRGGVPWREKLARALWSVCKHEGLLQALQSRDGFVRLPPVGPGTRELATSWADWRGPRRDGTSEDVPERLPARKRLLWSHTMTGPGMSGLAVAEGRVIVADKSADAKEDIFRCLDADTVRELWKLAYTAAGAMDFTNSPRAFPVVCQGLVYLLGAFGHLHCARLENGEVLWKKNLVKDFEARRPSWGYASAPLVVGDALVISPGGQKASLVALDRRTGEVRWKTPGPRAAYASPILAELGGVPQIVGYDSVSLGGWDPETGKRLWRLVPTMEGDFNVPTPLAVDGRLLVSTENNGTRLYEFGQQGRIRPKPAAVNEDLAPDTVTPVAINGMLFGSFGRLLCLDLEAGLKTLWENGAEPFTAHNTFIAGNGRVLVISQSGKLTLVRATKKGFQSEGSLDLFDDVPAEDREVWSHPALVKNRLYVRNLLGVYCFVLE